MSKVIRLAGSETFPEPPADLTPEQRDIWRRVVRSRPPGWWDEASMPLLVQYVRAIDMADSAYARAAVALAEGDASAARIWSGIYDAASKSVRTLAVAQRLSQSSVERRKSDAKAQAYASAPPPPWET